MPSTCYQPNILTKLRHFLFLVCILQSFLVIRKIKTLHDSKINLQKKKKKLDSIIPVQHFTFQNNLAHESFHGMCHSQTAVCFR